MAKSSAKLSNPEGEIVLDPQAVHNTALKLASHAADMHRHRLKEAYERLAAACDEVMAAIRVAA